MPVGIQGSDNDIKIVYKKLDRDTPRDCRESYKNYNDFNEAYVGFQTEFLKSHFFIC